MIDVLGRFRSQSNIQSFFKTVGGSNTTSDQNRNKYLTNEEKIEAKKRGFIVPKLKPNQWFDTHFFEKKKTNALLINLNMHVLLQIMFHLVGIFK